jgi:hypothetical protein
MLYLRENFPDSKKSVKISYNFRLMSCKFIFYSLTQHEVGKYQLT